ncbi:MAG: cell envelope integrity protein TolA [Bradyrhizobium sp.]|uniref:cell envelope integrity protein TolA n=1 Tax=Bradyrhizobium sp. TaxID=376 RepID=UPI002A34563B|nr:cell envelope integrity protein TolA [Bradyrhizobium sp.]
MKVKVDKTVLASVALHVLVLGAVLLSFSTRALEVRPEESVGVDISLESQVAAGMKTGKKEEKQPLVEKVAEAKPTDDAVGKIDEKKQPVVTDTAPEPQPKVVEKPEEKKPEPPKVAEKPKEEPKPVEKKPEPAVDPIAEAIKKEEKKKPKPPKPPVQAAKPPEQHKPKERVFDQSKIAALIDKRDPSRHAATGDTLNSNASLGLSKGRAGDNSATWGSMFRRQVENCWKKPYGGIEQERPEVAFNIRLKKDGTLEAMPVPDGTPSSPYARAYSESALRAIIQCQPYKLPAQFYDEWKAFIPVFQERPI